MNKLEAMFLPDCSSDPVLAGLKCPLCGRDLRFTFCANMDLIPDEPESHANMFQCGPEDPSHVWAVIGPPGSGFEHTAAGVN